MFTDHSRLDRLSDKTPPPENSTSWSSVLLLPVSPARRPPNYHSTIFPIDLKLGEGPHRMWGWFGGAAAQTRKDAPKNAILMLRQQLEMLQKRERHLETQMSEQDVVARKNITTNKNGESCAAISQILHEWPSPIISKTNLSSQPPNKPCAAKKSTKRPLNRPPRKSPKSSNKSTRSRPPTSTKRPSTHSRTPAPP